MPTESTFLLAGLFFLAAALGYFFARSGDDEEQAAEEEGGVQLNADYIKGLNFLMNEQPDQALEVFMRMVEVDDETLETHFALGSLFRRRGEIDRAIRVHQNIIARPNLSNLHREQALVSLAEDYLSAGLFDRAEELFEQLAESDTHGVFARRKLIHISEVTQEWERGIEAFEQLAEVDSEAATESRVAHYYCELAERAVAESDLKQAAGFLAQAEKSRNPTVRSRLLQADLLRAEGKHAQAAERYQSVMASEPRLIGEVVPRLAESCRALDDQALLSRILEEVRVANPSAARAIALAAVYDDRIVNPTALDCLREYILDNKALTNLVDTAALNGGDPAAETEALERIRSGLNRAVSKAHRYQCRQCGYSVSELLWQCPSCRVWETISPSAEINLSGLVN